MQNSRILRPFFFSFFLSFFFFKVGGRGGGVCDGEGHECETVSNEHGLIARYYVCLRPQNWRFSLFSWKLKSSAKEKLQ